jgi:hypothetical protein
MLALCLGATIISAPRGERRHDTSREFSRSTVTVCAAARPSAEQELYPLSSGNGDEGLRERRPDKLPTRSLEW